MAILLPQLSQLLNSIQQLTASFFLKPTILWISLAAPSPGLCSFLITTAVLSSTRCPNWCAPGHSPDPHLLSHCTFTWHLICSQNFVVLTPQFICPALGSPLNIWLIYPGVYLTYPLGCLIIISNLTYPKQNLGFQFFHILTSYELSNNDCQTGKQTTMSENQHKQQIIHQLIPSITFDIWIITFLKKTISLYIKTFKLKIEYKN